MFVVFHQAKMSQPTQESWGGHFHREKPTRVHLLWKLLNCDLHLFRDGSTLNDEPPRLQLN